MVPTYSLSHTPPPIRYMSDLLWSFLLWCLVSMDFLLPKVTSSESLSSESWKFLGLGLPEEYRGSWAFCSECWHQENNSKAETNWQLVINRPICNATGSLRCQWWRHCCLHWGLIITSKKGSTEETFHKLLKLSRLKLPTMHLSLCLFFQRETLGNLSIVTVRES